MNSTTAPSMTGTTPDVTAVAAPSSSTWAAAQPQRPGRPVVESELPPRTARFVERARLDRCLDALAAGSQGTESAATTAIAIRAVGVGTVGVWGAAGTGKTTLISEWARRLRAQGERVAWFSAAADGVASAFAEDTRGADADDDSSPTYVFIDDVHLLGSELGAQCLRLVAAAATAAASTAPHRPRVVLAGRWQPFRLPASLLASDAIAEVHGDELAFTPAEAAELGRLHDLSLPPAAVESLVARTGGWAAGLALAMPWLHSSEQPGRAVSQFDGDNRAVADYLVSEIVEGLTDNDRDILMASAVRSVVPLELAGVLTGRPDAGAVLRRLSQRNALITEEPGEMAYRYHPVLLAFMQAESWRRDSSRAEQGHVWAARWFADRGDGLAAVEQAIASRSAAAIGDAMSAFAVELVATGRVSIVMRAVRAMRGTPETLSTLVIRLLLETPYFADPRLADNLVAAARTLCASADGEIRVDFERTDVPSLAPSARALDGSYWRGLFGIIQAFRATGAARIGAQLRVLESPEVALLRSTDLAVDLLAATATGWCLTRLNRLESAEKIFIEVAQSARGAGYEWLFLLAADLGSAAASRNGHWMLASSLEAQMADLAGSTSSPTDRRSARATLLLLTRQYERGEPVSATVLDKLANPDGAGADFGVIVPASTLLLLMALDDGSNPRVTLDRLNRLMAEAGAGHPRTLAASCVRLYDLTSSHDGRGEARAIVRLVEMSLGHDSLEAELLRFLSSPADRAHEPAETALVVALAQSRYSWRSSTVVSAWLALAQLAERTGRRADADARLVAALRVASNLGIERPFLHFEAQGAELVETRLGRLGTFDEYARLIVDRAGLSRPQRGTDSAGGAALGLLTRREHELLRELPLHQTVTEIAAKQSVSANTAKTHLRSIYSKLGASDRAQAVAIAKQRGLL